MACSFCSARLWPLRRLCLRRRLALFGMNEYIQPASVSLIESTGRLAQPPFSFPAEIPACRNTDVTCSAALGRGTGYFLRRRASAELAMFQSRTTLLHRMGRYCAVALPLILCLTGVALSCSSQSSNATISASAENKSCESGRESTRNVVSKTSHRVSISP